MRSCDPTIIIPRKTIPRHVSFLAAAAAACRLALLPSAATCLAESFWLAAACPRWMLWWWQWRRTRRSRRRASTTWPCHCETPRPTPSLRTPATGTSSTTRRTPRRTVSRCSWAGRASSAPSPGSAKRSGQKKNRARRSDWEDFGRSDGVLIFRHKREKFINC